MRLAQSSLKIASHIRSKYSREGAEAAIVTIVSRVGLGLNAHTTEVQISLYDQNDSPIDYSLPLEVAKPLADRLPAYIAEIEAALGKQSMQ